MTAAPLWLPGAKVVDLRADRGNGPFAAGGFYGVILHVNVDENGTSDSFFEAGDDVNPDGVTPTFQVYKSEAAGGIHQYLPFDWQPACQRDGNYNYGAIETAGMPDEPLTDYQLDACAKICAAYHAHLGMPLTLADKPGDKGLGTHQMGGAAWGGHPCPGTVRTAQRPKILELATPKPPEKEFTMTPADEKTITDIVATQIRGVLHEPGAKVPSSVAAIVRDEVREQLKPVLAAIAALPHSVNP